jgi:hypothetical protein
MTELCTPEKIIVTPLYIPKNVYIEGNKEGFNSKIAIDKFKITVKKMDEKDGKIIIEDLGKYIKPEFKLELINYDLSDNKIIFKIVEKTKIIKEDNKKMLKEKIKNMKKNRTNSDYHKAKNNENVTDEILKEYNNLKKISKMPVPEPSEILSNPDQYKPLLNMVLNNQMINQIGTKHPYIKYFKLISDKLNMSSNTIPDVESQITTNKISNNDDDTDEED